jgi:hypothetical protein
VPVPRKSGVARVHPDRRYACAMASEWLLFYELWLATGGNGSERQTPSTRPSEPTITTAPQPRRHHQAPPLVPARAGSFAAITVKLW